MNKITAPFPKRHWFSHVLFIATHRELMSITELIKDENVDKYIFTKMKKKSM